ncbi:MAG: type II secretion system protein [Candidatus Pacebacteria bacterium]|jgi:prepilin-type N-terminal cleavage/methylation domain-containing protein|nr:type II secretion system protein [Candidatus Paceibacterota bacterium]MDD5722045.1 type II secretion system protein [Candidatus Paceibacterota bacterium]
MKNKKGFTLIEMLIVITIIAVLASLILVGMGGAQARSRDSRRIADLHNMMNALELYNSKHGLYPDYKQGKIASADDWDNFTKDLKPETGVSSFPRDPLSTTKYFYRYVASDELTDYILAAVLEQENPALRETEEETVLGISCGISHMTYCIRP